MFGIHHQVLGDFANSRELVAFPESACFHRVLHLLNQLQVKRDTGGLIDSKDHVARCIGKVC